MIIALTGSIGSGKSRALAMFAGLGWGILSADQLCHDIYNRKSQDFMQALTRQWGDSVCLPDGSVNRKALADRVFSHEEDLRKLNELLHPLIRAEAEKVFQAHPEQDYIFEVPLLFETGWERDFDGVICIWSSPEVWRRRLHERGLDDSEINRRLRYQWTPDAKLAKADFVLINDGSPENLMEQCLILTHKLKETVWKRTN